MDMKLPDHGQTAYVNHSGGGGVVEVVVVVVEAPTQHHHHSSTNTAIKIGCVAIYAVLSQN